MVESERDSMRNCGSQGSRVPRPKEREHAHWFSQPVQGGGGKGQRWEDHTGGRGDALTHIKAGCRMMDAPAHPLRTSGLASPNSPSSPLSLFASPLT